MKIYGGELVASGSSTSIPVTGLATTGSNTFNGNQTVNGSLTITGNLTAQQFIISSSVTHLTQSFSSGSHKFGDSIDDTHQFTGSILMTGSLSVVTTGTEFQVNAGGVNLGNALTDNHIISGSVRINPTGLFVSSSGDVLVGTTSSTYSSAGRGLIVVNGTTNALYGFSITGATKGYMYHNNANVYLENSVSAGTFDITQVGAGAITFTNNGAERVRINSTGALLVGTASNLSTGAGTQSMVIRNGTNGQGLYFASVLNTADHYVPIGVQYDTTNGNNRAEMRFAIDGSDTNTRISFHTAAGAGTLTERMRITSAGRIIVNNSVSNDSGDRNLSIQGSLSSTNNDIAHIYLSQIWNGTAYPIILAAQQDLTYGNASSAFVLKTSYWNGSSVTTGERLRITATGVVLPGANGTQDFGSTSLRWGTIFTSDLSLSNGIGDYTIVEGEEKLYLYNNKNNKVYSFVLQEEDPATATPKKS